MQHLLRSITVIQDGITTGLHIGAQLYVSIKGQTIADIAIGDGRPGEPLATNSLMLWMSCTKPIGAVAIAQLWERGLLDLDDRVSKFIPAFAAGGKEAITIRHILTHTGGFRVGPRRPTTEWNQTIAELCATHIEPGWIPGKKAGYHPTSSWFILGEIVRLLSGQDYSAYVRQHLFEPLGMTDTWVGMSLDVFHSYGSRIVPMYETKQGITPPVEDVAITATSVRPPSNGYGPLRELGRFYEMLLNHGSFAGARVLSPQTVEAITARHRWNMFDATFKRVIDWGLGFILNTNSPGEDEMPYGFGPYASSRTFGHGGAESSAGFCDPESGLVVAYAFNGRCGEQRHHARRAALMLAIYADLNLAQ